MLGEGDTITIGPEEKAADFSILNLIRHSLEQGTEGLPERQYVSRLNLIKDQENAKIGEFIPPRAISDERRDMNVTTDTAGGYLVAEDTRRDNFVAALGPVALVNRLGVEVWPGLIGNLAVPAEGSAPTIYWLDEGMDVPESDVALGGTVLRPRTVGCLLPPISRNLLVLGLRKSTEPILKGMVRRAVASGIDTAFFAGSGVDGQPLGILNVPGIDSRSGAAFALATATAMIRTLEDANIATEGAAWCASPDVAELLRKREKETAGNAVYLLGDDNKMCGRPFFVTTSIPAGKIILGAWAEGAALPTWGPGIEVLVDDKTLSTKGQTRIIAFASIDVFVRRVEAFAIAEGLT
jgi:HK97 family phage major capsid protein